MMRGGGSPFLQCCVTPPYTNISLKEKCSHLPLFKHFGIYLMGENNNETCDTPERHLCHYESNKDTGQACEVAINLPVSVPTSHDRVPRFDTWLQLLMQALC